MSVRKLLNDVKISKAGGSDTTQGIPLKTFANFLARPLTKMLVFNGYRDLAISVETC